MRSKINFVVLSAVLLATGGCMAKPAAKTYHFENRTHATFIMNMSEHHRSASGKPGERTIRIAPFATGTATIRDRSDFDYSKDVLATLEESVPGSFNILRPVAVLWSSGPKSVEFTNTLLNAPDNTTFAITRSGQDIVLTPVSQ